MSSTLRGRIEKRAGGRCEYCLAPMAICSYTFHIEHCIPKSKAGASGKRVALFHPVEQSWKEHFCLKGNRIEGTSPAGRATAAFLEFNTVRRQAARAAWRLTGLWP